MPLKIPTHCHANESEWGLDFSEKDDFDMIYHKTSTTLGFM